MWLTHKLQKWLRSSSVGAWSLLVIQCRGHVHQALFLMYIHVVSSVFVQCMHVVDYITGYTVWFVLFDVISQNCLQKLMGRRSAHAILFSSHFLCSPLWCWNILQYIWTKTKMWSLFKEFLPGWTEEDIMQTMSKRYVHNITRKQVCGCMPT